MTVEFLIFQRGGGFAGLNLFESLWVLGGHELG